MKKGIRDKLSNFFNSLTNVSLVSWMSGLGFFIGLPLVGFICDLVWNEPNGLNLFGKIFITLLLVIIGVLYTAGTIALNSKEEEEKERYRSFEDYYTYEKFTGWRADSYAKFIVEASNEYVGSIYEKNMNYGINRAIMDFITDESNINSLYSIKLFDYHIRQQWEKYKDYEITCYCFLLPYGTLSMTPFTKDNRFKCYYDKEFLDCLKRKKSVYCDKNEEVLESIVEELKHPFHNSYHNNEFNVHFINPESFDYWGYIRGKQLPIFVKVQGNLMLEQHTNNFVIGNCSFEEADYGQYMSTLREKNQE